MGLDKNLEHAKIVVAQVKMKVKVAGNRGNDRLSKEKAAENAVCANNVEAEMAKKVEELKRSAKLDPHQNAPTYADQLTVLANEAIRQGCGNCGPQSALAFNFLVHALKTPANIEQMDLQKMDIDHQFVVVGRQTNSEPTKPATWGPDAVVCDPWHDGNVYPAADIQSKMYRGQNGTKEPLQPISLLRARWTGTGHVFESKVKGT